MAKTMMSMKMPKVGDRLMRVMTSTTWDLDDTYIPESCVVTYINEAHKWFEICFLDSGLKECYNLPTFDHSILSDTKKHATTVVCIETGAVYSTLHQCARDMGVTADMLSRHLRGEWSHCGGYHFCTVM